MLFALRWSSIRKEIVNNLESKVAGLLSGLVFLATLWYGLGKRSVI